MRKRLALTALALATAVTAGFAAPATAAGPDPVRQGLETLVRSDRAPGALASVMDANGKFRTYTAGTGDRDTHAKVPRDGQVRIGSVTKTFTAVVVMQLVGEGKIRLNDRVDDHLPGLVRGKGIDGHHITVQQLLQHTSGLPDFEDDVTDDILERRYLSPRDSLDIALKHEAAFEPGTKWSYSNTNYLVAGLIVEKVTGRPLAEQIDKRIIQPLGLRHTYFPAPGETAIRERHPQGYHQDEPPVSPPRDVTEIDPSASWAAGAMVSTNSDLNRFFSALLKGGLLPDTQLEQMLTTIPVRKGEDRYSMGLGIMKVRLSKDCVAWGHNGGIPGYGTWAMATADGRAASATMTREPKTGDALTHLEGVVDAALCRR
ncbi:beta-lactamase [Streptomyces eurocidicus]|uniref:Beta-lactamase n=1 Tax=Streptomyces eurocidicus TaxID=66423 RepID=A0A2N8NVA5_STREU|nr:serine hydrolase domain-containing protein [Streptomyces eurocidicus]MBB5122997.1 D-alanyl-D-alanine carboxypeptidase [Streptomyces eurocidicus]MBF6056566.1 serine hydrolase [Streptomyces eurocidicus]PNE32716.1 beta-lactamase [Streptomyces eurocidicus]